MHERSDPTQFLSLKKKGGMKERLVKVANVVSDRLKSSKEDPRVSCLKAPCAFF